MHDDKYYQEYNFDNVDLVVPDTIKKIRENKRNLAQSTLDTDILLWLDKQDDTTKRHINDVIRHFMAIKTA